MNIPSIAELLGRTSTMNRKIFRAITVIGLLSVIVKVVAAFKELIVANHFGRSEALDAFLIAFLLPSFLSNLLVGSFNNALVPTFTQVRETEGQEAAQRLFSSVLVWSIVLMAGMAVLMALLAPYCLPWLGSGFSAEKLILTRQIFYAVLPFFVIRGLVGILSSVLYAVECFSVTRSSELLIPLVAALFLVLGAKTWGIYALAFGTVLGCIFQLIVLARALRRQGLRLRPVWYGMDANLKKVAGEYVAMLAGALLVGGLDPVDQSMAAMLKPGSVAALNYGNKIISGILAIGAAPLGAAIPYTSQMVARRDWAACKNTLKAYSSLIVLASIPVSVGLVLFSTPLIRIVFERGAFTAADTEVVSRVQALYSLQIPFHALVILGATMISSLKQNRILTVISGVRLVANVFFNYVFMKSMGVAGIALSTSVVHLLSCAMIYGFLFSYFRAKK